MFDFWFSFLFCEMGFTDPRLTSNLLLPEWWDSRCVPPCQVYVVLRIQHTVSCMLGKHFIELHLHWKPLPLNYCKTALILLMGYEMKSVEDHLPLGPLEPRFVDGKFPAVPALLLYSSSAFVGPSCSSSVSCIVSEDVPVPVTGEMMDLRFGSLVMRPCSYNQNRILDTVL